MRAGRRETGGAATTAPAAASRRSRRSLPQPARLPALSRTFPLPGLLSLADELLIKVLLSAGASAVARAATLCRRLRDAQVQLALLPAFACAACTGGTDL